MPNEEEGLTSTEVTPEKDIKEWIKKSLSHPSSLLPLLEHDAEALAEYLAVEKRGNLEEDPILLVNFLPNLEALVRKNPTCIFSDYDMLIASCSSYDRFILATCKETKLRIDN